MTSMRSSTCGVSLSTIASAPRLPCSPATCLERASERAGLLEADQGSDVDDAQVGGAQVVDRRTPPHFVLDGLVSGELGLQATAQRRGRHMNSCAKSSRTGHSSWPMHLGRPRGGRAVLFLSFLSL